MDSLQNLIARMHGRARDRLAFSRIDRVLRFPPNRKHRNYRQAGPLPYFLPPLNLLAEWGNWDRLYRLRP
jgi:hypothetical protein